MRVMWEVGVAYLIFSAFLLAFVLSLVSNG